MKKIIFIITAFFLLTACQTINEKTGNLKKPFSKCPPKEERTLKDIFCKE